MENLSFAYEAVPVVQDANFTINAGEFACIVGPNGGGKTTLLKLLLGLIQPGKGSVRLFGQPPSVSRNRVGYLPQHAKLDPRFPASVLDVALMGRVGRGRLIGPYSSEDRRLACDALREVDMLDCGRQSFGELSGGQRQRVLIARALASRPELLLFDEPTAHLDVRIQDELYELLAKLNHRITVVVVSHDIGFVTRHVRKVICVNRTAHVHDTAELTGELIGELYGPDVRIVRHDHCCEEARPHA